MKTLLNVRYDRNSDVLYISVRREVATKGVEDRQGIIWRYDREGGLIGATVLDYQGLWEGKGHQLATELSRRFEIPTDEIKHALEAV
jgi:uncharacterized protein YuzE